jgi:hypothetical protein
LFASIASKPVESAEAQQGELSHLQLNLLKEQVTRLARETAGLKHDNESMRSAFRNLESELEKEAFSRRKDGEEFMGAFAQLKQMIELERYDRAQALQALDSDIATQLQKLQQNVRLMHEEQMDAGNSLRMRVESVDESCKESCKDLRSAIEEKAPFSICQRLDNVDTEVQVIAQKLEKETRELMEITMKNVEGRALRADLEKAVGPIPSIEKEVAARKLEIEELVRSERAERKAMGDHLRKGFEENLALLSGDQASTDSKYADLMALVGQTAKHVDVQSHLKNFAKRYNDLVDSFNDSDMRTKGQFTELKTDLGKLTGELREVDAQSKKLADDLARNILEDFEQDRLRHRDTYQHLIEKFAPLEKMVRSLSMEVEFIRFHIDHGTGQT